MKKLIYLVFFLLSFALPRGQIAAAATNFVSDNEFKLPLESTGPLRFALDLCQFQGPAGKAILEVYYSVDLAQFVGSKLAEQGFIELMIESTLLGAKKDTIGHFKEMRKLGLSDRPGSFVDLKKFSAEYGGATLKLTIGDASHRRQGSIEKYFWIREFSDELSVSDLLLSSHVEKATGENTFERGGLVVLPRPSRAFAGPGDDSRMFCYFEINNLNAPDGLSSYRLEYDVSDLQGNRVFSGERPQLSKNGPDCARVETIPLAEFKTGHYKLSMHVFDLSTGANATRQRYFSYSSTDDKDALLLPMAQADIDRYYEQIKYIATHEEKKLFRELSARGKQEFLLAFWRARDPVPETSENEFMTEYFQRMAYSDEQIVGGINSDMGRIYVKYGEPVERVREFSRLEYTKPVETWIYAQEGRIEFVFVDRSNDGKFVLVHSTQRDEISNHNWRDIAN